VPWRESSVVEERIRFVAVASRGECNFGRLCQEFGISRQTGYTWLKRYAAGGSGEMFDKSRRPLQSPAKIQATTEERIIALRQRWPDWGARKLHAVLQRDYPEEKSISSRTVHRVLDRNGLILDCERHRPATKRFEREAPNQLWQMDFKGPQGFNTSKPVGPLSIEDDHSRYLIVLKDLGSTKLAGVHQTLQQTFEQVGIPESLLIDHGTPWWNGQSPWGITELTVWIMRQGIRLLYSGVRHPQTQGKVERMHASLQRAVRHRKASPDDQQWLDTFRYEYNHIRPHESLGMQTPAARWQPSHRPYTAHPPEWEYSQEMEVCELDEHGRLSWQHRRWEISAALRRQKVGLQVIGNRAIVLFCKTPMRELDLAAGRSIAIPVELHTQL
jgi:transposase InsO family protein